MDARTGRHIAAYRMLLLLYPATFRHEYGPSMVADFAERLEDERRHRTRRAAWRTWKSTLRDLLVSAPEQRWEELMARTTAAVAVYSLAAWALLSALTRTLAFTWLIIAVLAVASVRWAANAPDPATGRARLHVVAWITLAAAAVMMPVVWWSGVPEALALLGVGLLVFTRRHRHPVTP